MSLYKLVVLVHILSALMIAASAFGGAIVRATAKRSTELAAKVGSLRIAVRLVSIFGIPGGLVAGATGIWLVLMRADIQKAGWVHASITLWLVLISLNLFYSFPRLKRMHAAAEASLAAGAPSEELKRLSAAKAPAMIADFSALAVVIFVVLMTLQPF